ncbi:MAG TPA: XrtN system VIT domain-containing protein, partial [Chitinophagaceae bacterium]
FIFSIPLLFLTGGSESNFGFFAFSFLISIAYFIILFVNRQSWQSEHKRHYNLLSLILFLISAYSLNRDMEVFAASPVWFCIVLVGLCANYILSLFYDSLPSSIRIGVLALLGVSTILFLYLSIYLVPIYAISIPGMLAFGISVHTFVPALLCVHTVLLVAQLAGDSKKYWISFASGAGSVMAVVIFFSVQWRSGVNDINRAYTRAIAEGDKDLPAWMQVAQWVQHDTYTEKILKSDLVYHIPEWDEDLFWRMPTASLGEQQKVHDPLVVLASIFSGKSYLTTDDKINILKTQFDARHHTEERLWSGKDLTTKNVVSTIRIWPEYHLAYTEKVLTVFNHEVSRWLNGGQEGIYTFHLPEGAVVTSLSLWVNGREEKGILTTKEKADSAYTGIVGVERRDPSVVHWQEGNRVTVRVFPVLSHDSRVFKVGVTAPLRKEGDHLVYDNVWFEGPDASAASESVKLYLNGRATAPMQQAVLQENGDKTYTREGRYKPRWSFTLKDEGLSPNTFSFNGASYHLKHYNPIREAVYLRDFYLDINHAWSEEEWQTVWQALKGRRVWVYHFDMVQLTEENREWYFRELKKQRFSLFPLHEIKDVARSLVICKSAGKSPDLSDLAGSRFLEKIKAFSAAGQKARIYNLGHDLSPYLSSLKDYRLFLYEWGNTKDLQQLLAQGQFVRDEEKDNEVVVHNARIVIVKEPGSRPSAAPDHLLRLFAFNHILRQFGRQGIGGNVDHEAIVAEAKEAYVVSPVSSLIVLETQQDYDRYGIEDSKNSLKNASIKSKGAVPEPHEWVLIILGCIIGIYLFLKTRF